MAKHSKRYRANVEQLDAPAGTPVREAIAALRRQQKAKFDETVEIALKLGIDPRQSEQNVRGSLSLPKGIGKSVRVIAFAEGDQATAAQEAGADEVGGEDLAKRVEGGWMGFDVAIAAPDMMRYVGKLGRILGPQGKMPSPKSGTVTADVGSAVSEFKAGKIEFRNDDSGNLHAVLGKLSFSEDDLVVNVEAFLGHINALRPASAKGVFIQKATLSSSMGPGIQLAL